MTQELVLSLAREAMLQVLLLSAPALIFGLGVGLLVSIFQATTQIQEQTLSFIPKIVAVLLAIIIFGSWMLNSIVGFTGEVFRLLPGMVR